MIRLLIALIACIPLHLRSDRRKGSHPQRTHGNRYGGSGSSRTLVSKGGSGKSSNSSKKDAGATINRIRSEKSSQKRSDRKSKNTWKPADDFEDDDLDFIGKGSSSNESRGEGSAPTKSAQQKREDKIIADMEKAERSRTFKAVQEFGGLKTNDDLREEYAGIPNTYKRKDGMAGDDMADHLAQFYPELGIESERDLIDFLVS